MDAWRALDGGETVLSPHPDYTGPHSRRNPLQECFYARSLLNRTYRHLFTAQVIALIGTGLATVALGLLAYPGVVLGTALAIKMIAYAGVAPIAGAVAGLLTAPGVSCVTEYRESRCRSLPALSSPELATAASAKVSSL